MTVSPQTRPDYGVDAPAVIRNLLLSGGVCLLLAILLPARLALGPVLLESRSLLWPGFSLLLPGLLMIYYVKVGKFHHRDYMLALVPWSGDEQVLDVGCGRGLLLAGAAQRLAALDGAGHVTGIDVWSTVDMGGNSPEATLRNLALEGVSARCTVLGAAAQDLDSPDGTFNVILSNLCLHNIYDAPTRRLALTQIVRVLAPGGIALISDYKLTSEYAAVFRDQGLLVEKRWGSFLHCFPPLTVVIAKKPHEAQRIQAL